MIAGDLKDEFQTLIRRADKCIRHFKTNLFQDRGEAVAGAGDRGGNVQGE
jgi:hypothetical protein